MSKFEAAFVTTMFSTLMFWMLLIYGGKVRAYVNLERFDALVSFVGIVLIGVGAFGMFYLVYDTGLWRIGPNQSSLFLLSFYLTGFGAGLSGFGISRSATDDSSSSG